MWVGVEGLESACAAACRKPSPLFVRLQLFVTGCLSFFLAGMEVVIEEDRVTVLFVF